MKHEKPHVEPLIENTNLIPSVLISTALTLQYYEIFYICVAQCLRIVKILQFSWNVIFVDMVFVHESIKYFEYVVEV